MPPSEEFQGLVSLAKFYFLLSKPKSYALMLYLKFHGTLDALVLTFDVQYFWYIHLTYNTLSLLLHYSTTTAVAIAWQFVCHKWQQEKKDGKCPWDFKRMGGWILNDCHLSGRQDSFI